MLPGAHPGHMSFHLDRAGGVVFVGDTAMNKNGTIQPRWINNRSDETSASIRTIAQLEFEVACFGHSTPIVSGAGHAFKSFGNAA